MTDPQQLRDVLRAALQIRKDVMALDVLLTHLREQDADLARELPVFAHLAVREAGSGLDDALDDLMHDVRGILLTQEETV